MTKILLIMDSRGTEFDATLNSVLKNFPQRPTVKILAVRGANLQSIEAKAIEELTQNWYDQTYIMLGINNLTRIFCKKQIILAFDNVPDLVNILDDMYTCLKTKLQAHSPKVIVCHLVGLDILVYNTWKMGRNDLLIEFISFPLLLLLLLLL